MHLLVFLLNPLKTLLWLLHHRCGHLSLFGFQLGSGSTTFPSSPWQGSWHGFDDDLKWLESWSWGDDSQGMGKTGRVPHVTPHSSNRPTPASFPRNSSTRSTPRAGVCGGNRAPSWRRPPVVFVGTSLAALLWDKVLSPGPSQLLSFPFTRWWFSLHCFPPWQPESMPQVTPICLWLREEANWWWIISCAHELVKMPSYTYFRSCLSISKGWFC